MAIVNMDLTERMRKATRTVHDSSDRIVNLKLAVAFTDKKLYALAISYFYYVYREIEAAIERHREHPNIQPFIELLPLFARTPGFEKDLAYYLGADYQSRINESDNPAVEAYLKHLREIEKKNPTLLLAYVYHMYMAILAGGQMIKKMAKKTMGLPKDEGTALLDLPETVSRPTLRKKIKEKMNALELSAEEIEALLNESVLLFTMNNKVASHLPGERAPSVASILHLYKD
jgi:heme oxygenase